MGTRRKAREDALKILYSWEVGNHSIADCVCDYWLSFEPNEEGRTFAESLVHGTIEHIEQIDQSIQSVSIHWRINRMAAVDRNILRMATYELFHVQDVPKRVTLNEAIEIAKRYGTEDSWAFINGILDKLAGDITE